MTRRHAAVKRLVAQRWLMGARTKASQGHTGFQRHGGAVAQIVEIGVGMGLVHKHHATEIAALELVAKIVMGKGIHVAEQPFLRIEQFAVSGFSWHSASCG